MSKNFSNVVFNPKLDAEFEFSVKFEKKIFFDQKKVIKS